ncbi:hypothetical protein QYF61_010572 [Mycteria americana]|uniref:Uncharacterized protein n=1 Tax=Mycteria americana TaxID=33587 RepID=A0AAN7NLJ6_MYCAM|nr:hypothetical protein QYF61_010572 [Mycteria americana]
MDAGALWVGEVILAAGLAPESAAGAQGKDEDCALDPMQDLTHALCNSINPSRSPLEGPALRVGPSSAQLPVLCNGKSGPSLTDIDGCKDAGMEKKCTECKQRGFRQASTLLFHRSIKEEPAEGKNDSQFALLLMTVLEDFVSDLEQNMWPEDRGRSELENRFIEKDEGVLVEKKVNVGQQCPWGKEGQPHTVLHQQDCIQQLQGSDPSSVWHL